jgi:hypothetical protein
MDGEVIFCEIDGGGVVELCGIVGLRGLESEWRGEQGDSKTQGFLHESFLEEVLF